MANTYGIKSVSGSLQELEMSRYGGTEYSVLTASSGQAGVTLRNVASGTVTHFTASYAKITELDVDVINTIATTQTTLEIADKLIIAASGANSANSDGGGLQIGGVTSGNPIASVKYDHANTALDFNIGSTTQVLLKDGAFLPETDSDVDLGTSTKLFKNLYVDAFGANWTNAGRTVADLGSVTTVDINGGSVDGAVIGAASAQRGVFTKLSGTTGVSGSIVQAGDLKLAEQESGKYGNQHMLFMSNGDVTSNSAFQIDTGASFLIAEKVKTEQLKAADNKDLEIIFGTDNSGDNKIKLSNDFADALTILDDNNDQFMTFDTRAASQSVIFKQKVTGAVAAEFTSLHTDSANIDGGAIDGTVIGANSAAAGTFAALVGTSLSVSDGNITNVGSIALDSITADDGSSFSFGSNWTAASRTCANLGSVTTADINGGTVDGTTIGGSSAANGTFLTLSSSAADLNGGTIDGVAIGLTSSAAGAFTTLDCNDGAFAVANLDIDGATDIGAALVDADLFVVDDGAGGTNRKSTMSRIPTYLNNHTSLTSLTSLVAVGTISTGVWQGTPIQDAYVAQNLTLSGSTMNNSVIGGTQPAAATFTTMIAKGNVDLGDATSDTITATGRFDSDLVPSTDSARSLGTSALQWANIHADAGAIDAVTVTSVTDGSATLTGGVLSGLSRLGAADAPVSNVFATNVVTGDFHMRNERGDWTLFEESDHIRVRNNATGQTFKMDMTLIEE